MTRQEDFKKKRNEYVDSFCYENEITSAEMVDAIDETFDDAADYGYQYAVDKACEWLESLSGYVVCGQKANVENFRKAMEE